MKATQTQTRGNCQCCGREQAVVNGMMSKHGYTVKQGWFAGVCSGRNYVPVQVSREKTDQLIASITEEVAELIATANKYESKEITPKTALTYKREEISFDQADYRQQCEARVRNEWACRNRARMGQDFIKTMTEIANKYHGQPLVKVSK
jgi:hypothetical protein